MSLRPGFHSSEKQRPWVLPWEMDTVELRVRKTEKGLGAAMLSLLVVKVKVKSLSRVQLLRPVNCSPPSSSVHGILQARVLEWVAISFSRGSSQPRDQTQVSHIADRCFNLCTTRKALKYKNTVSQKTSYRDTELQIQVLTSKISREERKPG